MCQTTQKHWKNVKFQMKKFGMQEDRWSIWAQICLQFRLVPEVMEITHFPIPD